MSWFSSLLDNPIFVKHARSRLRRPELTSTLLIVGVLLLLIVWWGMQAYTFSNSGVFVVTLILQGIILLIVGSGQVGASVSNAQARREFSTFTALVLCLPQCRRSDFCWVHPCANISAYALYDSGVNRVHGAGRRSWSTLFQTIGLSLLIAWALHAWTMVLALFSKKPSKNGPIGFLIFLGIMGLNSFGALFRQFGRPGEPPPELQFFGVPIPFLAFGAIYLIPVIFFGMLIATRKIRHERAHPLSKIEAVAFMIGVGTLATGGLWPRMGANTLVIVVLYIMVVAGLMLSITITPMLGEYTRGVRRAARLGVRHLPPWDELALNRPAWCAFASSRWRPQPGRFDSFRSNWPERIGFHSRSRSAC